MKNKFLAVLVALGLSIITSNLKSQIIMYSGFEKGSYNQVANDIKSILPQYLTKTDTIKNKIAITNENGEVTGQRDTIYYQTTKTDFLDIRTSGGSIENYRLLIKNTDIDVAFLQFDVLLYEDLKRIRKNIKRTDSIRILLPLGIEEVHLVTLGDDIEALKHLKGKKVAIGNIKQGTQITSNLIKEVTGVEWQNVDMDFEKSVATLLKGEIDAFFFVGAAPVPKLVEVAPALQHQLNLVPLNDPSLDAYYSKATIKANTYNWVKEDVETYAVNYVLATNIAGETPEDRAKIEQLLLAIKQNIQKLKDTGHPAWQQVDFNFSGIDWEIHDVAKKVFGL